MAERINIPIPNCPKKLRRCPGAMCPLFRCRAYTEHMDLLDRKRRDRDSGWE